MPAEDEIETLRAERDEWRRRAEVAEAIAAERLARAETAERAVRAAEDALAKATSSASAPTSRPAAGPGSAASVTSAAEPVEGEPKRPTSLRERWRRYTETIN